MYTRKDIRITGNRAKICWRTSINPLAKIKDIFPIDGFLKFLKSKVYVDCIGLSVVSSDCLVDSQLGILLESFDGNITILLAVREHDVPKSLSGDISADLKNLFVNDNPFKVCLFSGT